MIPSECSCHRSAGAAPRTSTRWSGSVTARRRPVGDGSTRFEVWAPRAAVGGGRAGGRGAVALGADERAGTWVGVVDGVGHGDRYRIRLDGGEPLADPASGWQPDGVHGPSAVVDPSTVRVDRRRLARRRRSPTPCCTSCTSARSRRRARSTASIGQLDRLAAPRRHDDRADAASTPSPAPATGATTACSRRPCRSPTAGRRRSPASSTPPTPPGSPSCSTSSTTTSARRAACTAASAPYFTDAVPHAVGRRRQRRRGRQRPRPPHVHRERLPLDRGLPRRRPARSTPSTPSYDPTATPFLEELTGAVHAAGAAAGRTVLVDRRELGQRPARSCARRAPAASAATPCGTTTCTTRCASPSPATAAATTSTTTASPTSPTALAHRWVFSGRYSTYRGRRHGRPADDVAARALRRVHRQPRPRRQHARPAPARRTTTASASSPRRPCCCRRSRRCCSWARSTARRRRSRSSSTTATRSCSRRPARAGARSSPRRVDRGGRRPGRPGDVRGRRARPVAGRREPHRAVLAAYTELLALRRRHGVLHAGDAEQTRRRVTATPSSSTAGASGRSLGARAQPRRRRGRARRRRRPERRLRLRPTSAGAATATALDRRRRRPVAASPPSARQSLLATVLSGQRRARTIAGKASRAASTSSDARDVGLAVDEHVAPRPGRQVDGQAGRALDGPRHDRDQHRRRRRGRGGRRRRGRSSAASGT